MNVHKLGSRTAHETASRGLSSAPIPTIQKRSDPSCHFPTIARADPEARRRCRCRRRRCRCRRRTRPRPRFEFLDSAGLRRSPHSLPPCVRRAASALRPRACLQTAARRREQPGAWRGGEEVKEGARRGDIVEGPPAALEGAPASHVRLHLGVWEYLTQYVYINICVYTNMRARSMNCQRPRFASAWGEPGRLDVWGRERRGRGF